VARDHGFPPVEREAGGRAVAYTGTTVAFVRAEPIADFREGLADRYDRAVADLRRALGALGVDAREGEPAHSFCPGSHSLRAEGKLVGVAQRVRQDAAVVGGVVVVRDHARIAAVLAPVYDALSVPFDPTTVDSVASAGGPDDPDAVRDAVEDALVGDVEPTVERVD
jgi:lipoate-protein ligase A